MHFYQIPSGPPALGSAQYLRDLAETQTMGRRTSAARMPDQTNGAWLWASGTGAYLWNAVTLQLIEARAHDRSTGTDARRIRAISRNCSGEGGSCTCGPAPASGGPRSGTVKKGGTRAVTHVPPCFVCRRPPSGGPTFKPHAQNTNRMPSCTLRGSRQLPCVPPA
jgi:hypothetical protein